MANGYLQTVQQGAYNSYQNMVDTAARLGALQEDYKQRQAALEEQQKAGIRSGVAQAQVVGGTLGWENLKNYAGYVNKTGDVTLSNVPKAVEMAPTTPTVGPTIANAQSQSAIPIQQASDKFATMTSTPKPLAPTPITPEAGTTFTEAEGVGIVPIGQQGAQTIGSQQVGAIQSSLNPAPTMGPLAGPAATTETVKTAEEGAKAIQEATGGASKLEIAQSVAPKSAELGAETATTAANSGALSTAMSTIGGLAGVGLGAYSMAKTGISVGNVSSMVGGGLMLGSLMEGAAFLGPWGLGIALAGGIASSIFGW